ncbi:MAG: hypothetical protein ACRDRA_02240 [Pseudonocardiaceae bacterium]
MSLKYQEVRGSLAELDELLFFEARGAGWDGDRSAEKAALVAARRLLAQLDERLAERIDELDGD